MARLADIDQALSRSPASDWRLTRASDMSERATHPYENGLGKNAANYVPLSPTSFLLRTASVYPDRLAVAYQSDDCPTKLLPYPHNSRIGELQ